MPRVGTVDERFQSYNVEMLEVTGGKFWKPYDSKASSFRREMLPAAGAGAEGATPAGMYPNAYAYRPPIDLTNTRRRKLAAALGRPTCGSAAPGRTRPISRIPTTRPRPLRRASAAC